VSNARSIERLIEVYQRGLTISIAVGVSFEHVFEIVIEARYGQRYRTPGGMIRAAVPKET
jgi:hypothetical protein